MKNNKYKNSKYSSPIYRFTSFDFWAASEEIAKKTGTADNLIPRMLAQAAMTESKIESDKEADGAKF